MSKWYIEYKAFGKYGHMRGIEANNGNEAIEILKSRVIGVSKIIGVWHDDDDEK